MNIQLRLEEERDYRRVEEVTREAFWNVYAMGCDEHFLVHRMRNFPQFVRELDFVAIHNGEVVGNIVYVEAKLMVGDRVQPMLAFGPVSVLPEYQGKGIGALLITHTAQLAREMGHKAILIYGDPLYYQRFGFKESKEYNITNGDHRFPAAMLVLELYPGALKGIEGVYDEGNIYEMDRAEIEEFDKTFPTKEKVFTRTQERFLEMVNKFL